jgi:hypothetical protein
MKIKKSIAVLAGAVCAAVLLISVPAQAVKNSIVITNESDWRIDQFFLASVGSYDWGPDQLGQYVIGSGETHTLRGIRCGTYHVKLVDDEGDACVIPNVDLCSGTEDWTITQDYLLDCEEYTQGE